MTVEAVSIVQTDASNIAETKGSLELTNLPVAIGTRSSGSTSAYSTLTAQPGVQMDNQQQHHRRRSIAVAALLQHRRDQFRWTGTLGALAEMFPSLQFD